MKKLISLSLLLLSLLLFACAPPAEEPNSDDGTTTDATHTPIPDSHAAQSDDQSKVAITPTDIATPLATSETAIVETPLPTAEESTLEAARNIDEVKLTVTPLPATQVSTPDMNRNADAVKIPNDMQSFIDTLIDDLEQRKGVQRDAIRVIHIEEKTWNDGSLGCPQPGNAYTQALVDGFYIVLQADGNDYPYHTSGTRYFVLCENQKGTPPASGTNPDV